MKTWVMRLCLAGICLLPSSCARHYLTPRPSAAVSHGESAAVEERATIRPEARFPIHLAVVRVQPSGHFAGTHWRDRRGSYCVSQERGGQAEEHLSRLAGMPGVDGVVVLNRLLLGGEERSSGDLRSTARDLGADMVLLYCLESTSDDHDALPPITVASLGLVPTRRYSVSAVSSAVFLDARSGFVYGTIEKAAERRGLLGAWSRQASLEAARRKAERAALEKLVPGVDELWRDIYARYSSR